MWGVNIPDLLAARGRYLIMLCLEDVGDDLLSDLRGRTFKDTDYQYAAVLPSSLQPEWLSAADVEDGVKQVNNSVREAPSNPTVQEQAAETLHSLADQLPIKGAQLDLLWFVPSGSAVGLEENAALLGALKRLQAWHGAQVTIMQPSDHEKGALAHWLSALEARYGVLSEEESVRGRQESSGVVWRGRMRLVEGKSNASLFLPGFQLSVAPPPRAEVSLRFARVNRAETAVTPIFDEVMDVVDIVDLDEVPRCLLLSEQMELTIPAEECLPRSTEFLNWLTAERDQDRVGIVVQLLFRVHQSAIPPSGSAGLGTAEWKEQLSTDCLNHSVPEVNLQPVSNSSCHYLLYRGQSGECCVRQFVPPSELNGAIPAQLAKMENLGAFSSKPGSDSRAGYPLNDILLIGDIKLQCLVERVAEAQLEGLKHFTEQKLKADPESVLSAEEVQQLLLQIRRNCSSSIDLGELSTDWPEGALTIPSIPMINPCTDCNPGEIPERLALINGEVVREKMRREKSKDFHLAGMVVPHPVNETITLHLNASEFLKHFHPSGLPMGQNFSPIGIATKTRSSTPSKPKSRPQFTEEELRKLEFEESLRHELPGVHYCTGHESLRFDTRMARLIQRMVPMETATTCSHKDTVPVIKVQRRRNRSLSKSPTKKLITTPRKSKSKQLGKTPRNLKRPRKAATGTTPVKRAKKCTASSTKKEFVSPRKSLRLATPQKASRVPCGSDTLPSPEHSERLSTPQKGPLIRPETTPRRSSRLATPRKSDPTTATPTKKSPQKRTGRTTRKAPGSQEKRAMPSKRRALSLSDTASQRSRKMSRSEKHKKKLMEIVNASLLSKGVQKGHPCYKKCFGRLYELTKSYVKDLKTSKGLYGEMRQISDSNVDFVVRFELKSKSTSL